jgi:hypothetical protein
MHIEDIQTQIARALDPAVQAPAAPVAGRPIIGFDDNFDVTNAPDTCWPDFAIRKPGGTT